MTGEDAAELQLLRANLRTLLPGHNDNSDRTNPLNLIIPAYETMWRVALRCFMEIRLRHPQYRSVFDDFLASPDSSEFIRRRDEFDGVSAADIVNETLRLYPPMKNIRRAVPRELGRVEGANIECLQQNSAFWGADASSFRPARWAEMKGKGTSWTEIMKHFAPFGMGPFKCPAGVLQPAFAQRMIGLVVGALDAAFRERGEWVADGAGDLEKLLVNDRIAYDQLTLTVAARELRDQL